MTWVNFAYINHALRYAWRLLLALPSQQLTVAKPEVITLSKNQWKVTGYQRPMCHWEIQWNPTRNSVKFHWKPVKTYWKPVKLHWMTSATALKFPVAPGSLELANNVNLSIVDCRHHEDTDITYSDRMLTIPPLDSVRFSSLLVIRGGGWNKGCLKWNLQTSQSMLERWSEVHFLFDINVRVNWAL